MDGVPVLNYMTPAQRSSRRGLIAIALSITIFATRIGWLHIHKPTPASAVAITPLPPPLAQSGLDLTMANSLLHNTEGQNVLYVVAYSMPTTQPSFPETPGSNSNAWLDNIYTVQTGKLSSTRGVVSGVPYDDKDAIMLPTAN